MVSPMLPISDRRRVIEIIAVILTGIGKFIFLDWLNWRLPFVIIAILAWIGYVCYRYRASPAILKHWGFRTDNFLSVSKMILPFGVVSVVAFFVIGYFLGSIHLTWNILPVLILYPLWGIIQQFLVIALVAGNLREMKTLSWSTSSVIFVTALLFGLIHYPYGWLMIGTFVLALLYGYIYLKQRNVFVMGIFHGWLGGLFFYTVVGRDPFVEMFGFTLG